MALITLKFELDRWINGDLVNSLVVRNGDFVKGKTNLTQLILVIKEQLTKDEIRKIEITDAIEEKTLEFLKLFDEKGIQKPYKKCFSSLKYNKSISNIDKDYRDISERLLKKKEWLEPFSFFEKDEIWTNRKKGKKVALINYDTNESVKDHLYKVFLINFLVLQIYNLLLERSIGSKWEKFIKSKLRDKIDFQNRKIYWQNLTDTDIEFISELILQFLLRKNPSPARLRRIWETTREFFEDLESRIIELAGIEDERQKRLVWDKQNIPDGKYQDGEIIFWAKDGNVYLITSIEKFAQRFKKENLKPMEIYEKIKNHDIDWIKEKEITLKSYGNGNSEEVKLKIHENVFIKEYKPYFTILSPTPISWQFIIPAENIPTLIKKIQEEYHKNFRWVYGKLPLHIGVIIQNYKKPLYVGIKALRNIRRDGQDWLKLGKEISSKEFKARQKGAFHYQQPPEKTEDCENFYSLFEKTTGEGKYEFYLYPDKGKKQKIDVIKEQIDTTQDAIDTDKFYFYQNTFDFEFMDTNTRRNDIYYKDKDTKRFMRLKRNRPYDIEDWQYFEKFEDYFKDKKSSSRLQKLISTIYSKMEDWEDDNKSLKVFMISAFANILDLKSEKKKDEFAKVLGLNDFEELESLKSKQFTEKLLMLIDMFEFYHTALKFENK